MPKGSSIIMKKLTDEVSYYRAQNENLKAELNDLQDTYNTNRKRLGVIRQDFEDSLEMISKLRNITSR